MQRQYWRAACATGAVAAALIAGGCAASPGGGTPRTSAAAVAGWGPQASAAKAKAAVVTAPRVPLTVPNSVRARKAVTLTGCTATGTGGHASGTVTGPGASAATYTITVFFTTRQATVIGYGTAKVHARPGQPVNRVAGIGFGERQLVAGIAERVPSAVDPVRPGGHSRRANRSADPALSYPVCPDRERPVRVAQPIFGYFRRSAAWNWSSTALVRDGTVLYGHRVSGGQLVHGGAVLCLVFGGYA